MLPGGGPLHPLGEFAALRQVVAEHALVPLLRAAERLHESVVLAEGLPLDREDRPRHGVAQVVEQRLALLRRPAVAVHDQDEPRAEGEARRGERGEGLVQCLLATHGGALFGLGATDVDDRHVEVAARLGEDAGAQPRDGAPHLDTVAAEDEIGGLQGL